MTSTAVLKMLAEFLGGLTFFLFGMDMMSSGLKTMTGGALERTLKKVTESALFSFFLGAGVTTVIQSSSAMTVMLIGLVNSGIIDFSHCFGVVMGSNVGTTMTAWLLSLTGISGDNFLLTLLKPMTFAPLLAFVGIVLHLFSRKEKQRNIGYILIGFTVLMTGMSFMSNSMKAVQSMPGFQHLLTAFQNSPALALLAAVIFTGIIQSSSAAIGIVQALALAGGLSYETAIPLVLGANIGTCITALVSSIGTGKNAKRVVAMHIYVNVLGAMLCLALLYVIRFIQPTLLQKTVSMFGVALVHTLFNGINTLVLFPFQKAIIRLCEFTVPAKGEDSHTVFLDERLFENAPLAAKACKGLTVKMARISRQTLLSAMALFQQFNEKKAAGIEENEELIDKFEDRLGTYLVRIGNHSSTAHIAHETARLLHSIGDFERIGDHALNLCQLARKLHEKKGAFSNTANAELAVLNNAIFEITNLAVEAFIADDAVLAARVEPLEQVIDKLIDELQARHIHRLQHGTCTVEIGFVLSELLINYERISDHCSNLAVYTIQLNSDRLDPHKYLHKIKTAPTGAFANYLMQFEQKYQLQEP